MSNVHIGQRTKGHSMSQLLDSALDAERRAECARNDDMLAGVNPTIAGALRPFLNAGFFAEAASQSVQTQLRPFVVHIKRASTVLRSFDVYAPSRIAAQKQHEDLCGPAEYVWAMTPEEARERAAADAKLAAGFAGQPFEVQS